MAAVVFVKFFVIVVVEDRNVINVSCYNCESNHSTFYAEENGFTLVKCSSCGLLYVTPRPDQDEIDQAHQCGVHQGKAMLDVNRTFSVLQVDSYLKKLKDLYRSELVRGEYTWLDIGCGHGELLTALQQSSGGRVRARGLEPNEHKQQDARARGLDVSNFPVQNHDRHYDFISLLNVYSHLPDPPGFLGLCRNLLKPGGELLLETGDTADLSPEDHYRPFLLPDHLSFVSEGIVTNILHRCGFEVRAIRKYPAFPFRHSPARVILETAKRLLPQRESQIRKLMHDYRLSRKFKTDMYIRATLTLT